jgi:hypothetical protein
MALNLKANRSLALTWSVDCEPYEAYTAMVLRDLATFQNTGMWAELLDVDVIESAIEYQDKRAAESDEDDASQHTMCAHTLRELAKKLHESEPAHS